MICEVNHGSVRIWGSLTYPKMPNMSRPDRCSRCKPQDRSSCWIQLCRDWLNWLGSFSNKNRMLRISPIFHVGVPTLDPTDRSNPRKFPPFHSVEKPIPRTLTMFCAFSEWFQGSSFQKNHPFWPPMSTVSLLYPLHTTLIIREHSYLFNSSSPFYQCLISRNFTIFCWGLTPCSIAKNWMYGSPWKNTLIEINIRIASSQLQTDDHRFLIVLSSCMASQMVCFPIFSW